jgi:NADPH2:quinone reductase
VTDEVAAAVMVKGCTVEYLVRRTYPVTKEDVVLLTAAAGGVGLIASQWLRSIGATVIGTAGTPEKAELARANGCDHVILYRDEDIAERVRDLTDGEMCTVAFDSVGATTFEASLRSLRKRGLMVTFGNASGAVEPIAPLALARHGSLFLTRPRLGDYYSTAEETTEGISALFDMITSGAIDPYIGARYPLREVQQAHRDLESRKTVGSTLLVM